MKIRENQWISHIDSRRIIKKIDTAISIDILLLTVLRKSSVMNIDRKSHTHDVEILLLLLLLLLLVGTHHQ